MIDYATPEQPGIVEVPPKKSARLRVLEWVRTHPQTEVLRSNTVAAATGVSLTIASHALMILAERGEITRVKRGHYTSAPGQAAKVSTTRKPRAVEPNLKNVKAGLHFEILTKLNDTEMLVRSVETGDDYFVLRAVNI